MAIPLEDNRDITTSPVSELRTKTSPQAANGPYRILIVDDNPSIHRDFYCILTEAAPSDPELDELAASLLGAPSALPGTKVLLDSAHQGEEAFAKVKEANELGRPYAVVFMDVRMQPGWSGVETAARIFEIDDLVHIILCTAYGGQELHRQVEGLPLSDRVLLLKKPFDPLEVRQLANAMCNKWTLTLRDRRRMQQLERMVSDKTHALETANEQLRREIAERARAEHELLRAQQLEGLGRLAAGLCHEINNPLTFIVGGIEAMSGMFQASRASFPDERRDELDQMLRSVAVGADRIAQIVRNVKLLSRQGDADAELVEVHAAVDTAIDMVHPSMSPHIELCVLREHASPMHLLGRRLGLEQVLLNLLKNSAQALACVPAGEAVIRVCIQAIDGRQARITVTDTGPGIPEAVLERVFEPFFTTKPVQQGTGLGLSICHSLVTSMNGTIEITSQPGRGTTFTITLPLSSPGAVETALSPKVVPSGHEHARGRVLIVDDERFILKVLKHVLSGHEVTTTSCVDEALCLCKEGEFDLILSDIMMPNSSGIDFYHALAALRPGEQMKIVFITGGTMVEDVSAFLDSVPNLCMEKPLDPHTLRTLAAERAAVRFTTL